MGNQHSGESHGSSSASHTARSSSNGHHHRENSGGIRHLLRNNGALGLSKAELDARCQPSGLYQSSHWEYKQIRRLIGDGKLAARCKGNEQVVNDNDMECPICFLQYPAVNKTKCCQAFLCTECYLQVRNPKESSTPCPFCNQKLQVTVANISQEAINERRTEELRVLEAQAKAKNEQSTSTTTNETKQPPSEQAPAGSSLPSLSATPQNTAFGASLEQNERVAMMRKRSTSGSSVELESNKPATIEDVKSLAMTPEERQALEAEMKAQHQHPLAQRIQQEEAERRFQNERDYLNSPQYQQRQERQLRELHARRLLGRSAPARTTRDWNRIVQAFESGTAGNSVQSLDDLVVLEAAIMLSSTMEPGSADAAAAAAGSTQRRGRGDDEFATRQARAGFPLARARVSGEDTSLLSSSRRVRPSWMMTALMSEEEQLAMAIAASLAEAPAPAAEGEEENTGDEAAGGDGDNSDSNGGSNNNNNESSNNEDNSGDAAVTAATAVEADTQAANNNLESGSAAASEAVIAESGEDSSPTADTATAAETSATEEESAPAPAAQESSSEAASEAASETATTDETPTLPAVVEDDNFEDASSGDPNVAN